MNWSDYCVGPGSFLSYRHDFNLIICFSGGSSGGALGFGHKKLSTHFFLLRFESKVPFPNLWDLQSSPGNWKWHKVTSLSIPLSDYQFDTIGAKIMKMVCFEVHHNK